MSYLVLLRMFLSLLLHVGLYVVWMPEDRSRSASAPTLGIVDLHALPVPSHESH